MRYVPVEEARKRLGRLVRDASGGEPVIIGRRGTDQAVLLSEEEYARLRQIEEEAARARFKEALESIAATVQEREIPRKVVEEAVRTARRR
ncbi:MAG TPA: type II toxin-antitoxin system Phd/YefM family antitoxin [bacterium]|nr:type II toxin-antitoxin system Phd/YefM family antitoxin [bacterium]